MGTYGPKPHARLPLYAVCAPPGAVCACVAYSLGSTSVLTAILTGGVLTASLLTGMLTGTIPNEVLGRFHSGPLNGTCWRDHPSCRR